MPVAAVPAPVTVYDALDVLLGLDPLHLRMTGGDVIGMDEREHELALELFGPVAQHFFPSLVDLDDLELGVTLEDYKANLEELVHVSGQSSVDTAPRTPRGPRAQPEAARVVETALADRLDTRVSVEVGKGKGKITIQFADLEDLERKLDGLSAAVIIQSPNFFGTIEPLQEAAELPCRAYPSASA